MMETLVSVQNLIVHFGDVQAVEEVSLTVGRGETLGIVGESGSGKSTLVRGLLRLGAASEATLSGSVMFDGRELVGMEAEELRALRREMQLVQQNPFASLDPSMTVETIIAEPLMNFGFRLAQARERVFALLELVGLSVDQARRFPHEFSGGQRQRIAIARALALEPRFLVCDEPTSALDVSVRAQIINLLAELKTRLGLTMIFVSHDLATVRHISDRIAVMYLGRIVEIGTADEIIADPQHPYTRALVSAILVVDPDVQQNAQVLSGEIPSPRNPPTGCVFHTRCPHVAAACKRHVPALQLHGKRPVACDRLEEIARPTAPT